MHVDGLQFFGQTFPGRPSNGAVAPHAGGADTGATASVEWRDTPAPCKLPRYRCHLGCILLKMPAISLLTGIVANFPMDVTQGSTISHTAINGATRAVAGTVRERADPPSLEEEPAEMKLGTLWSERAPAGCVLLRDIRGWHGGVSLLLCLQAPLHVVAPPEVLTRELVLV